MIDLYCCPESFVKFDLIGASSNEAGYFRFGQDNICYGRSATGFRASRADGVLYDAPGDVTTNGSNAGPNIFLIRPKSSRGQARI